MTERVVAVDCDLRRVHAWDSVLGKVCYRSPDIDVLLRHLDENHRRGVSYTVLYEIASATDYTDDHSAAIRYNKRRWMLWNMATAVALSERLAIRGIDFFVASSQVWTQGYTEEQRREIACADASNHDLRECQAMIFFQSNSPQKWITLPQFLARL